MNLQYTKNNRYRKN